MQKVPGSISGFSREDSQLAKLGMISALDHREVHRDHREGKPEGFGNDGLDIRLLGVVVLVAYYNRVCFFPQKPFQFFGWGGEALTEVRPDLSFWLFVSTFMARDCATHSVGVSFPS